VHLRSSAAEYAFSATTLLPHLAADAELFAAVVRRCDERYAVPPPGYRNDQEH
jgi:hypothetical protein